MALKEWVDLRVAYGVSVVFIVAGGVFGFNKYDEWSKVRTMRLYVNSQLKDPDSTQYRNEQLNASGWLCGELNSKNSTGGYVGFKRFMASAADNAYLEDHGYVGIVNRGGNAQSTAEIIEKLDLKIEVLKQYNALKEHDFRLSEYDIDAEVSRKLFNKKWKNFCDQPK